MLSTKLCLQTINIKGQPLWNGKNNVPNVASLMAHGKWGGRPKLCASQSGIRSFMVGSRQAQGRTTGLSQRVCYLNISLRTDDCKKTPNWNSLIISAESPPTVLATMQTADRSYLLEFRPFMLPSPCLNYPPLRQYILLWLVQCLTDLQIQALERDMPGLWAEWRFSTSDM